CRQGAESAACRDAQGDARHRAARIVEEIRDRPVLMLGWFARLFRPAAPAWVEADELRDRLASGASPLVLDVRAPDEFDGPLGHIDGARNIPLAELPAHRRELAAAGRPVVCVCLTDKRSSQAAAELAAAGVRNIAVLHGGMKTWRALDAAAPPA